MDEITSFSFATSQQIVFKPGAVEDLRKLLPAYGKKALLISNGTFAGNNPVIPILVERQIEYHLMVVSAEPNPDIVRSGLELVRQESLELVIAIGGGSVIDAGKAIAMLAANGGDLIDYIEIVGKGYPINKRSIPFVAIPTTAGTGSEVTRNAVISLPEHGIKASLRSDQMFPWLAVVDPNLTMSMTPEVTAYTGLDAFTQVIEPYLSIKANQFIDIICLDAIGRAYYALERAFSNGKDLQARTEMAYVSLAGGIALTNAGLGAVHGFAAAIGGLFPIPHGMICGCLLPSVLKFNWNAIKNDDNLRQYQIKFFRIAKTTGFTGPEGVDQFIESLFSMKNRLGIHKLGIYGITESTLEEIADKAENASSMKANPIRIPREDLIEILHENI